VLSNPSQLLQRQENALSSGRLLVLNPEQDQWVPHLSRQGVQVQALAFDYQHQQQIQAFGFDCEFGVTLADHQPNQFDQIVLYFPKTKPFANYLIALAAFYLKPAGQLWLVGENKSGIKNLAKQVLPGFDPSQKTDQARHCVLFETQLHASVEDFDVLDWVHEFEIETAYGALTLCHLPGVFSDKKLDSGTAFLLDNLPEVTGEVLDFGCGSGAIACTLLKKNPKSKLTCVDINAMALKACELTLAANGLQANIEPSNGVKQLNQKFNAIVSNPPFHDGLKSTLKITQEFIQDCAQKLKNHGLLHLVANHHLGYANALGEVFGSVNIVAKNSQFKIYQQKK
jgi:16S rRNA (guanine1207-N2)-methyltransferase